MRVVAFDVAVTWCQPFKYVADFSQRIIAQRGMLLVVLRLSVETQKSMKKMVMEANVIRGELS
jgi:hypothetical protein